MSNMSTMMPMAGMDHNHMDHGQMDHGQMDHGQMDHGQMDHGGHNMGMDMNDTGCMMPGMTMYFHSGTCEYVLFESIKITNAAQMAGACIVVFFLAMLYEGLKCLREYIVQRSNKSTKYIPTSSSKETMVVEPTKTVASKIMRGSHLLQTLLHMLQVFVSYCLMLIFMTYNVYLGTAVVLGAGAGYFFFGWKQAVVVDINEHCH